MLTFLTPNRKVFNIFCSNVHLAWNMGYPTECSGCGVAEGTPAWAAGRQPGPWRRPGLLLAPGGG